MDVSFKTDEVFAAAVRDGIREALLDPEFRAALFEHVARTAADYIWLSRAQVAEMLGGKSEKTVARWGKKNVLEVNDKISAKEHLYSLRSIQTALESGAIRAKKAAKAKPSAAAPVPVLNGQPAASAPLRGVVISPA